MNNIKNVFYEKKDYNTYDYYHKYMRIDDIIEDVVYITYFTENLIEAKKVHVMEDDICDEWYKMEKTLNTLCVDDVLVKGGDLYRKVIAVINRNCIILSGAGNSINDTKLDIADNIFTVKELEDLGYEPYIEEEEEDNWREQLVKIVKEHSDEITMRYNIDGKIIDARPMNIDGEDI